MAVARHPHVAGRDADDFPLLADEKLGRCESGIDLDAERLGARPEPARDRAERADVIAVVAHQFRHRPIGQFHRGFLGQKIELIGGNLSFERAFGVGAPVRGQAVEPDRIDHRAREDMRADRRTLFHDHNRDIGVQRFEPDRGGEPRGTRADDHDVVFHRFAGGQCRIVSHCPFRRCRPMSGKTLALEQPRGP